MPDNPVNNDGGQSTNPSPTPAPSPAPAQTPTPNSGDVLPQWARDQITRANNEAAQYRINARDASQAAEQSNAALNTLQAQHQELNTAHETVQTENTALKLADMKLKAAIAAGIPTESLVTFAELLKGETEEALKAHAEQVKQMFGPAKGGRAVDPSQGQGNSTQPPAEPAPGLDRLRLAYQGNSN